MKTVKTLCINGQRFALPDGMTQKEIASLAGQLISLEVVKQDYDYDKSEYMSYIDGGSDIKVEAVEVWTKAAAREQAAQSYKEYRAKRDAEAEGYGLWPSLAR